MSQSELQESKKNEKKIWQDIKIPMNKEKLSQKHNWKPSLSEDMENEQNFLLDTTKYFKIAPKIVSRNRKGDNKCKGKPHDWRIQIILE